MANYILSDDPDSVLSLVDGGKYINAFNHPGEWWVYQEWLKAGNTPDPPDPAWKSDTQATATRQRASPAQQTRIDTRTPPRRGGI